LLKSFFFALHSKHMTMSWGRQWCYCFNAADRKSFT